PTLREPVKSAARSMKAARATIPAFQFIANFAVKGAGASRAWSLHRPTSFPIGAHGHADAMRKLSPCRRIVHLGGGIRPHLAEGSGRSYARNRTEPSPALHALHRSNASLSNFTQLIPRARVARLSGWCGARVGCDANCKMLGDGSCVPDRSKLSSRPQS